MNTEQYTILQTFITLIPVLTIAWKGSAMITKLEQMVINLNKCIQDLREDREKDKLELKEVQKNHELRIKNLEEDMIEIKSYELAEIDRLKNRNS